MLLCFGMKKITCWKQADSGGLRAILIFQTFDSKKLFVKIDKEDEQIDLKENWPKLGGIIEVTSQVEISEICAEMIVLMSIYTSLRAYFISVISIEHLQYIQKVSRVETGLEAMAKAHACA